MSTVAVYETSTAQDGGDATKSDSTVYDPPFRAVYVGTGGIVVIKSLKGNLMTHKNVANGQVLDVAGTMIMSTTTTGSDFVVYY